MHRLCGIVSVAFSHNRRLLMAGKEEDNADVDRIPIGGGYADVEFSPEGGSYIGLFEESNKPYMRLEFNGAVYIEDLRRALERLKKKLDKKTGKAKVERVCLGDGYADVEFSPKNEGYIGLLKDNEPYVRIKFGSPLDIETLVNALKPLEARVAETEK